MNMKFLRSLAAALMATAFAITAQSLLTQMRKKIS